MYYSNPGALKVQGLAPRKVTTGSRLNSCKLLAEFGEAGKRGGRAIERAFLGLPAKDRLCRSPYSLEGIPFLDAWKSMQRAPII